MAENWLWMRYSGGAWQSYFFPALTFAHRFLAAALMLASPCGEIRLPLIGTTFWPFRFAHLALCAAAIRRGLRLTCAPCGFWKNYHPMSVL